MTDERPMRAAADACAPPSTPLVRGTVAQLPIMVVGPLPASDHRRGSRVYLRSGIVNAHSSSDGSRRDRRRPVMDRVLSSVFPEPIRLCGEGVMRRVTKSRIGTFNAWITRAI